MLDDEAQQRFLVGRVGPRPQPVGGQKPTHKRLDVDTCMAAEGKHSGEAVGDDLRGPRLVRFRSAGMIYMEEVFILLLEIMR